MKIDTLWEALDILPETRIYVDVNVILPGGCMFLEGGGELQECHVEDLDATWAMMERCYSLSEAVLDAANFRTTPLVFANMDASLEFLAKRREHFNGDPRRVFYEEAQGMLSELREKVASKVDEVDEKHQAFLNYLCDRFRIKKAERPLELLQQAFLCSEAGVLTFASASMKMFDFCNIVYRDERSPLCRDSKVRLHILAPTGLHNLSPRDPAQSFDAVLDRVREDVWDVMEYAWAKFVR